MKKISNLPSHIAIILDGNGRWAKRRGLPRSLGHYQGGMNLVTIANYAETYGIKQLSVYAFSTENWNRPKDEVDYLMTKPIEMIEKNLEKFENSNIKIVIKGRKDRISKALLAVMIKLENLTKDHMGLTLNICFDYGSYDELLQAFSQVSEFTKEAVIDKLMIKEPVDLLIRTGGEMRLSNFMLWQMSYAELYFTKKYWPEFNKRAFDQALIEFSKRKRRFGGL